MHWCFLLGATLSTFLVLHTTRTLSFLPDSLQIQSGNHLTGSSSFLICGLPINRMDSDNASAEEELGWEYSEAELAAAMIFEKSDSASMSNAIVLPSQSTPDPEPKPVKRKPGRPKRSLNKHKRTPIPGAAGIEAPKRLGRPPGTGKNQLARLAGTIEPEPVKNPVGRPRLHSPPPRTTEIRLGKIAIRGVPPPLNPDSPHVLQMKDGRFIMPDRLHTVPNDNPANPDSAPSFSEHQIIPELNHDGSNVLDLSDEEDEYVGLLNDGVGEDDNGSDESGGESDKENGDPTAAPPKVRRTVKALPNWLKAQFDEKRAEAAVRSWFILVSSP
ncbi:hypothetical protein B0H16DRAFT_1697374 [Mycena metata]|uniref:Uncharacterized protein n=1 Tax=Mycena metata TaxID=1033252 RepID=A0AAD7HUE4_9AGAR|nr:hypothetical protein B0H16DRAFT_1697374 [Mycena metata]